MSYSFREKNRIFVDWDYAYMCVSNYFCLNCLAFDTLFFYFWYRMLFSRRGCHSKTCIGVVVA